MTLEEIRTLGLFEGRFDSGMSLWDGGRVAQAWSLRIDGTIYLFDFLPDICQPRQFIETTAEPTPDPAATPEPGSAVAGN
jgi:hypothetical protein